MFKRVIILIIDACGVGALPDADQYGDVGAATLPNIAHAVGGLTLPHCQNLGLGNIADIKGVTQSTNDAKPIGCFGKMAERSVGKDSTCGHWEIGGVVIDRPLPVFPDGFPAELVDRFETLTGIKTIGNITASGTEIIDRLGEEHCRTGAIILYTSADSVFQLAAHEEVIPLEEQYKICQTAREMLQGEFGVGRVIARPFLGKAGRFTRTTGRKDFSLEPPGQTILDLMLTGGFSTLSIGKIFDLFAERGFSDRVKAKNNTEVMDALIAAVRSDRDHDLIFANCVDFDMLWGHRNDVRGFAEGLVAFDIRLGELLPLLQEDDLLIITADHGCDPTLKHSTDHTREYVPLLAYGPKTTPGVNLGTRDTFADVACTVAEIFGLRHSFPGTSFLREMEILNQNDT